MTTPNPLFIGARGTLRRELEAIAGDELADVLRARRISQSEHERLVAYLASETADCGMLSNAQLASGGLDNSQRRAIRTPALAIVRRFGG